MTVIGHKYVEVCQECAVNTLSQLGINIESCFSQEYSELVL